MRRGFAALLSVGVLVVAGCDAAGEASDTGGRSSPALAMPVPLSDDEAGEPEWAESCVEHGDGSATCTYDDGHGTTCEVAGDAEGHLVHQTCRGEWGTYTCVPSETGYSCVLEAQGSSCTDEYDAEGQWIGGTCGDTYQEGGEYEEECHANDEGGYTCTYDDGQTQCTAEVDANGQLLTERCAGAWGAYDCDLAGAEYQCVLTVEGESCVETYDLDYSLTSSTCEDYYADDGSSSSEPSEPCYSYGGLTYCWSVTAAGYCYEYFATGTEPPAEELRCESKYTYLCTELPDVYGQLCIYSVDGVEVCRDTFDYSTYEGVRGCDGVPMGPPL